MPPRAEPIPEKYAKLKQAESAGLPIPKGLLLSFDDKDTCTQGVVDLFVETSSSRLFIVRSANLIEDGGELSLAGHFWTSGPVAAGEIVSTIQEALKNNTERARSLKPQELSVNDEEFSPPPLILQEYIEHTIGGVIFSPWSYFSEYAYIECSHKGVKSVVEGLDGFSVVLSLDSQYPDPLPLESGPSNLRQSLADLCCQLRDTYDFPIDCEWAFEQQTQQVVVLQVRPQTQQVVVLQVRPQTHRVGPILPYSKLAKPNAFNAGNEPDSLVSSNKRWQFTAFSESLGRLSPLSFSLLKQLYHDSVPMFQALGCKARSTDFMTLAPDGTVLVDQMLEKDFYAMTMFGGFKRGLQHSKHISETSNLLEHYSVSLPFSYQMLQKLCVAWMGVNVLSAGAGRGDSSVIIFTEPPHAYELSWAVSLTPPIIEPNRANQKLQSLESIDTLNTWSRALFIVELNKLKNELKRSDLYNNALFFSDWGQWQANEYPPHVEKAAKALQHSLAPHALYDHALSANEEGDIKSLSSTQRVDGALQIVIRPTQAKVLASDESILVAPYFDSRWVGQIRCLKGIVVSRGGYLSHSAIVAREYDVPYYVVPELDLGKLDQGQVITLDLETVGRDFT